MMLLPALSTRQQPGLHEFCPKALQARAHLDLPNIKHHGLELLINGSKLIIIMLINIILFSGYIINYFSIFHTGIYCVLAHCIKLYCITLHYITLMVTCILWDFGGLGRVQAKDWGRWVWVSVRGLDLWVLQGVKVYD